MAPDGLWRTLRRSGSVLTAILIIMDVIWSARAGAERSTFKTYAADQGLASPNGTCLAHDGAGEILICTEHGVFAYDGRRFLNLGPERGLPEGGIVLGITSTLSGRVAVHYDQEIYVSDQRSDLAHPATSLSFSRADHSGIPFHGQQQHGLAAWGDGFAFLTGSAIVRIVVPTSGHAQARTIGYRPEERLLLRDAKAIFSIRGSLWAAANDGHLCIAEPGRVRCYGAGDGLTGGPWLDAVSGPNGGIAARSPSTVATFNPSSDRWSSVVLPDQGQQYQSYDAILGLYRTPEGGLITQSAQGIDVLGPDGWRELTVADGAPDGVISDAMTDGTGQLWFQILGRGLVRWLGFGRWDTLEKADGLSAGFPWQTARSLDGTLWVSTSSGVDQVVHHGSSLRIERIYPKASFALAATPDGRVWTGDQEKGIRIIEPSTGLVVPVSSPQVETIVPGYDQPIWLGTTKGLYRIDDFRKPPQEATLVKAGLIPVHSIARDGADGVYYLSDDGLHHWHPGNIDVLVSGAGGTDALEPMMLAAAGDGSLWVSGTYGLRHLVLSDDRVQFINAVPVEDIGSNTVYALMVDHRGWVWVGTSVGISVYDGRRWVSTNADQGLISNDINENGIREDPDGSVWITTTSGVSHLKDPASLFVERPLSVMVTQAHLGTRPVGTRRLPYTAEPLSIELGTPNYEVERSVVFRHRLSGVDAEWVSSPSGVVSYPFIPPGHHVFTVVGYDPLAHRSSAPTAIVITMAYPWWRQWWSEALWAVLAMAFAYGCVRLRDRAMYARQAQLERMVAEATAQLRYVASHDRLTGLLTRSEIEGRLAGTLAEERGGRELVVALLDVDHFKAINDNHGHLGGDEVLRALGRLVTRALRGGEYAGRYGGEEMLLVLSDADGGAAERILDLHLAIRQDTFRVANGAVRVTCSIGVAWAGPGDDWESLVGRADAALYEAKGTGRDRVIESRPRVLA